MYEYSFTRIAIMAIVTALVCCNVVPAFGQSENSTEQNWSDFVHFVRVARPDVAQAYGQALLADEIDPVEIYKLSISTIGSDKALAQAANIDNLTDIVFALREKIEKGYRGLARSPENIAKALELLEGHAQQMNIAQGRLKESGEFAVPQMIKALESETSSVLLCDRISDMLPLLGREAVRPLCEALKCDNAVVREIVCTSLGKIGYWHAAPYLKAVIEDNGEIAPVKDAAAAALIQVTGDTAAENVTLADYFYQLGNKYYDGESSVMPGKDFAISNVWYWQQGLGLSYTEVPAEIFRDVYAMQCARLSLASDRSFAPSVTLWLQANLRKEADLPAGKTDPTRGANQLGADAYAAAAGAGYMQQVLARSLAAGEIEVVKDAISALSGTAGAANLITDSSGKSPLVSALSSPDRRVRMMAADVLARAGIISDFDGSDLVVTSLIEALRQSGSNTILVIDPDFDSRNRYKDFVRSNDFNVIDGDSLASGLAAVSAAGGAEMVLISTAVTGPDAENALKMMRDNPLTAVLPVIIVADMPSMVMAKRMVRNDDLAVYVESESFDKDALAEAIAAVNLKALGGEAIESGEAQQWMLTAAKDIRLLGKTRTPVFNLARCEMPLTDGLKHDNDQIKVACAQALAVVPRGTAQQSIAALAGSAVSEDVRIRAYAAAAESVRNYGRQLTDAQAQAVVDTVKSTESAAIRNAASELLGALDLPSQQIKSLIINRD